MYKPVYQISCDNCRNELTRLLCISARRPQLSGVVGAFLNVDMISYLFLVRHSVLFSRLNILSSLYI